MTPRQPQYNDFWQFASERQEIFFNKIDGKETLSPDPILSKYKFTNAYRASDRVSQYLIKEVIYKTKTTPQDTLFRILLFKLFNKIATWESLTKKVGEVSSKDFQIGKYTQILDEIKEENGILYNNAYIMAPTKVYGDMPKHYSHLHLIKEIMTGQKKILNSASLEELFNLLKTYPMIGDFMAYQLAIDLNYSELFNFDENDFTVPGPGAKRGIKKVFKDRGGLSDEEIIMHMTKIQKEALKKLGIKFKNLFGRRLHVIDIQNLFCEFDKYSRVKYPHLESKRSKIKNKYSTPKPPIKYFYPPKWGISP